MSQCSHPLTTSVNASVCRLALTLAHDAAMQPTGNGLIMNARDRESTRKRNRTQVTQESSHTCHDMTPAYLIINNNLDAAVGSGRAACTASSRPAAVSLARAAAASWVLEQGGAWRWEIRCARSMYAGSGRGSAGEGSEPAEPCLRLYMCVH